MIKKSNKLYLNKEDEKIIKKYDNKLTPGMKIFVVI